MNRAHHSNTSVNWKLWAGLIISALFLYLAFRGVDLHRIWLSIRTSDPFLIVLVVLITFFQYIIRSWRWRLFLDPIKRTGFANRFFSVLIGFAANCILPARLGEWIRANYLGKRESISVSSALGTLVIERLFDGFTLLLILLIGLLGTTFTDEFIKMSGTLRATGLSLFISYDLIIIFILGFKYRTRLFLKFVERILFFLSPRLRSRIIAVIWNFSLGLVPLTSIHAWIFSIFYSFLLWFSCLYQIQLIEYSLGLSLPFIATFLIMAMASFGVMIPSAPGFIGTFHLAVQYGFLFYGLTREEALTAAILWHATFFFPTILFGLFAFLWLQMSYSRSPEKSPGGLKEVLKS